MKKEVLIMYMILTSINFHSPTKPGTLQPGSGSKKLEI